MGRDLELVWPQWYVIRCPVRACTSSFAQPLSSCPSSQLWFLLVLRFLQPPSCPHAQTKSRLTVGLEDSEDLVSGNALDLGDTVRVTENDTDLGWGETSSGELEDLVGDLLRGGLGPRRLRTTVRESRGAHTLSFRVHSGGQQVPVRREAEQHTVPFWLAIR